MQNSDFFLGTEKASEACVVRDRTATVGCDAVNRGIDRFFDHRHVVCVGVDHMRRAGQQGNMPFPEHQVAGASVLCPCRKGVLLQIAVTGAGNVCRKQRGLNEARTIDPRA